MSYFYSEIFLLPLSHDEVVHGKKTIIDKISGSYEEKFPQLRLFWLYMFTHPGKKLNFHGQ
jgi:1,4-alpha-glucan branching enzyme